MAADAADVAAPLSHVSLENACSFVPPGTPRVVIDSDGDLTLKVGLTQCVNIPLNDGDGHQGDPGSDHGHELPVVYTVCSRTMSRASPVWKTLLYGGFAESRPSSAELASDWLVELPDDDPKAMKTVLSIIHSRFDSIPRVEESIDLEELYQLTVLTDKYDLTAMLRPWASTWMKSAKGEWEKLRAKGISSSIPHLERLSWISWVMGDTSVYERVAEDLARFCAVDANGDLQYEIGNETVTLFSSTLEPPGLHDELKMFRLSYVKNTLAIYRYAVSNFLQPPGSILSSTICQQGSEEWTCEAAMLGAMIRSLAWIGYWPLPAATDTRASFSSIWHNLKKIDTQSPVHTFCKGLKMREEVFQRCWAPPVKFKLRVIEQLAKQAAKSGL
ncbi:hypothetical protein F5Y03DRAFT_348690 [Xylaria venustula]|nr:hypothetical protein F5Y03DRAFT_348690 [Xylaria venustula]